MRNTVRHESGFTLIELIVVLLIMTTVMAISAPRLTGRSETAQLQAAAADVQALGTAARSRAILRNQSVALFYDEAEKGLQLALADDDLEDPSKVTALSQLRRLAEGLTITIHSDAATRPAHIVFLPDGSASAGQVSIVNNSGLTLTLTVSVSLGRFELPTIQ